jgi:MarR family transcriptional regulator, organic hydroperoxide resistance regulator
MRLCACCGSRTELGARLALDSATMTGIIDRLEKAGLVERRPDLGDRRMHRLSLTAHGLQLRQPLDAAMEQLNREFAELLGKKAATFHAMLRTVGEVK